MVTTTRRTRLTCANMCKDQVRDADATQPLTPYNSCHTSNASAPEKHGAQQLEGPHQAVSLAWQQNAMCACSIAEFSCYLKEMAQIQHPGGGASNTVLLKSMWAKTRHCPLSQ
mmetsp:Transcript_61399/g.101461  ORF Transcript_61399/g.101461 Transcript_61399/m.101461 type:complete len:113 (-) Transcript_61399:730-1068(-)